MERRRRIARILTVAVVVYVIWIVWIIGKSTVRAQTVPLPLLNPDFESGFHQPTGEGELTVGTGWYPDWNRAMRRPEWVPHRTSELESPVPIQVAGGWSQKMFVTYGKMDGWIRQDIDVEPDAWYKITAWVYMRSEDNSGDVSAFICVNPWGDWNALDRTTVCGKEVTKYDQWVQVEVIAPSFGDRISIFLRGVAKWAMRWNDVYWDMVEVERIEMGGCISPTPIVCPTRVSNGDCPSLGDIGSVVQRIVDERRPVIWTPNP